MSDAKTAVVGAESGLSDEPNKESLLNEQLHKAITSAENKGNLIVMFLI
jgi:hypothetical protein